MATITIRHLDDQIQRRLKRRAAANNRSMEAEARAILAAAVTDTAFARAWLEATDSLRGDEVPLPGRHRSRELDLT